MAVHFINFRNGDSYQRACKVWGLPDFIHPRWDYRAAHGGEWAPGDVRVFATGSEHDTPNTHAWDDSARF